MRRILFAALVLTAAMVTTAWAVESVRIGAYLPMTGNVAAYGEMAWSGITVAHEMVPTVLGRPVELKLVDTKSDKVESANSVSRLIDKEKVVALIGEMISGNTIAGSDHAERREIPMVSPTATSAIVTQGKKYVFRVCFIDPDQGRVAAKLASGHLNARTAALIYDISQDYCLGLANFFKKEFAKQGGKIVAETMFKSGDRDFTPQLSRIQASNPDIIYAPIYYTECALVARQAREIGLNVPILAGDGVQAPELVALGGTAVEGLYFTAHFHRAMISTELGKELLTRFEKQTGKPLDAFSAMGADAYFIIIDAIKRAGSPDSKKIRNALAATRNFPGVTGEISLKEDGNPIKAMVINKVKDGKFEYVTTINP